MTTRKLDDVAIRKVAAFAQVDPRTVRRVLDGYAARSKTTIAAICAALRELGHAGAARRLAKEARRAAA